MTRATIAYWIDVTASAGPLCLRWLCGFIPYVGCELQICITVSAHEMKVQLKPAGLCFNSGQVWVQHHTQGRFCYSCQGTR